MATNYETGHAVNISNFKLMIDKITVIPDYDPSNNDLKIPDMTAKWSSADSAHQTLTAAVQSAKNPINAREILFKPIKKLTTRMLNGLESTKASKQIKKDAKGLSDKIRGFGIKVMKLPDGTPDPAHISTSHQSYVMIQDTFKQLIDLLASEPLYNPNENDLKIATLTALNTSLKSANDNIGTIIAPVDAARVTRNMALYKPGEGMIDIAFACKDYIVSLLGSNSVSRLVTSIRFRKYKLPELPS